MLGISTTDIFIIVIYFLIITYLGWKAKNKVSNTSDYFLGGRRGTKIMQIANALGAGTHTAQAIAVTGASYQIGLTGIWYQWLYIFSTPFYWLLAPVYRRTRYVTIGDFFEKRYSLKLSVAYSLMGILYFIIEMGLIFRATSISIEVVMNNSVSYVTIILCLTVFFLLYSVMGGLTSALIVNVIQGILIVVLSFLMIPFAWEKVGSISHLKSQLPNYMVSFVAPHELTGFAIIMLIINALVGTVVIPHHMAINGSGKSEMNCRIGWTYGNFTKRLATLGWALVGIYCAVLIPNLPYSKRELAFGLAIINLLPVGLIGLMISAMIATVLAVSHNYMIAGSALLSRHFIAKLFIKDNISEIKKIYIARLSSVLIVFGSVIIAIIIPDVVSGLKYIWQITAFFGIGFWMGIIWKRANSYGVWASLISSILLSLYIGDFTPWSLKLNYEYQILTYLPAGLISLIIFSLLTKSEDEKKINEFYTMLHTPVGEEYKLQNDSNIAQPINRTKFNFEPSLEEKGHSLIIVDLLNINKKFSFKKYRIDIIGFILAWLFVIFILSIGYLITIL